MLPPLSPSQSSPSFSIHRKPPLPSTHLCCVFCSLSSSISISDVSTSVDLSSPFGTCIKNGSACVYDLYVNSHVDLLFGHYHSGPQLICTLRLSRLLSNPPGICSWTVTFTIISPRTLSVQLTFHLVTWCAAKFRTYIEIFHVSSAWPNRWRNSSGKSVVDIMHVMLSDNAGLYARRGKKSVLIVNLRRWATWLNIVLFNSPRRGVEQFLHTL